MKRYFDLHDKKVVAQITVINGTSESKASAEEFKEYFKSEDVREITLSQYRRMKEQYNNK